MTAHTKAGRSRRDNREAQNHRGDFENLQKIKSQVLYSSHWLFTIKNRTKKV